MKFTITMDSNEQTSRRLRMFQSVCKPNSIYEWGGLAELDCDVQVSNGSNIVNIELKEPKDLIQSVCNGHLSSQVITLQDRQQASFITCLGSVQDAMESVSLITKRGYRSHVAVQQDRDRVRSFCSDSFALGIPVFFWDDSPAKWAVSHAKHLLTGGDIVDYLPKGNGSKANIQRAILCVIPSIGTVTAKKLLKEFGKFDQPPWKNANKKKVKKLVGDMRAERLSEVFNLN